MQTAACEPRAAAFWPARSDDGTTGGVTRKHVPALVLAAAGISPTAAERAIRVSALPETNPEAWAALADAMIAIHAELENIFSLNPSWQLVKNRPRLNGLQWAFLVLSARGVKYEVQHEVVGCTKSALKRARERVLALYGNRLSSAMVGASFDGHIQPWHLDPKHVRFVNDT